MESVVESGGAKAIGLISASMSQITSILAFCKIKPAVNSVEVPPLLPAHPPSVPSPQLLPSCRPLSPVVHLNYSEAFEELSDCPVLTENNPVFRKEQLACLCIYN
jgi:hypothetical protein